MDFLQSEQWRKFQEAAGRRTFLISDTNFHASIIEHELPAVGKYFYIPRGPVCHPELDSGSKLDSGSEAGMTRLLDLAKKEKAGWIRIDVDYKDSNYKIVKAPHDMQPKEVFVIDIKKSEEELLAEMKSKTRYNIKLSQKHNVSVKVISSTDCHPELDSGSNRDAELSQGIRFRVKPGMTNKYINEFIRLIKVTAERDKITPHPDDYYRQMFEIIPEKNIKLYVAEYEGKIIAANIVIFYPVRNSKINTVGNDSLALEKNNNISNGVNEDTAIYLHGASDNEYRNVMAPYLLQWQQILDAKKADCTKYDFGGIKTGDDSSWSGITKFKTGFSPNTQPIEFSGSYDIILDSKKYYLYRVIQYLKKFL